MVRPDKRKAKLKKTARKHRLPVGSPYHKERYGKGRLSSF